MIKSCFEMSKIIPLKMSKMKSLLAFLKVHILYGFFVSVRKIIAKKDLRIRIITDYFSNDTGKTSRCTRICGLNFNMIR